MSKVGQKEILTQRQVIQFFQNELGYAYLGDWKETWFAKWEPIVGVEVSRCGVKRMKTKWGTCNIQSKRIWLNLELAKKQPVCLEYILVHEMVHLLERQHNDRFRTYMDMFLPAWRTHRDELNRAPLAHEDWDY